MQKSALKSVNVQRTGNSILQMFAFSFFGRHPYLQIFANFASPYCPSESILAPINRHICTDYQSFTFADIRFCVGKWNPIFTTLPISTNLKQLRLNRWFSAVFSCLYFLTLSELVQIGPSYFSYLCTAVVPTPSNTRHTKLWKRHWKDKVVEAAKMPYHAEWHRRHKVVDACGCVLLAVEEL